MIDSVCGAPSDTRMNEEPMVTSADLQLPEIDMLFRSLTSIAVTLVAVSAFAQDDVVYLDQGWTADQRQEYYHQDQGSRIMPYAWFVALEQASSKEPFIADAHISSLRYLPGIQSKYNPDKLPVGFAKGVATDGKEWVGMSCSACHTGQIAINGKQIRLDGGQSITDFNQFEAAVVAAMNATWQSDDKFCRFATKVLGNCSDAAAHGALRKEVRERATYLANLAARSRSAHRTGWGRMDAFNILLNEMAGTAIDVPENYRTPVSPTSYPYIWLTPKLDWVLYNVTMHNLMARDLGECIAVYGPASVEGTDPENFVFKSTGNVQGVYNIEMHLQKLQPPKWPEDHLGAIDQESAKRGAAVYAKMKCAECHHEKAPYPLTEPNKFGKQFIPIKRLPIAEIGTDPVMATVFAERTVNPGKVKPLVDGLKKKLGLEDQKEYYAWQVFLVNLGGTFKTKMAGFSEEELVKYIYGRDPSKIPLPNQLKSYIAEPLAGIWATAPYLHNGSVPNLYELFLPASKRSKTFHTGSREYDPKHVGYVSVETVDSYEYDTSVLGNSNSGHEFAAELTDQERWDLVEYLKTF